MHYCLYLFTRKLPDDEEIRRIMYPFNDENDEKWEQPFHWDWYVIGGRYGGEIHAEVSSIHESDLGLGYSLSSVNKKEVRSRLFDTVPDSEYMMYSYIIEDDHSIRVDGAYIKKITNYNDVRDSGYVFVTEDGRCTARDDAGSREYDKLLSTVFNEYKDGFLTILDVHD